MKEIVLEVTGMMCSGCENRVQNVIKQIDGIEEVKADFKLGKVIIKVNKEVDINFISQQIEDLGYEVKNK